MSQGFNFDGDFRAGFVQCDLPCSGLDDEHLSFGVPMPQHPFADSCSHPGEVEGVRVAHSGCGIAVFDHSVADDRGEFGADNQGQTSR